jgi:hypothetical protein
LIAIKAFQVLLGPIYDYLDGRLLGHSLRRSEKKRLEMRDEKLAKGEEYLGWKVHKPTTWFFGCQYAAMVLVSWVVSGDHTNLWCDELMIDLLCLFGIRREWMHENINVPPESSTGRDVRPNFITLWIGSFVS